MTRIVIAAGGGFGLELYGYLRQDLASGRLPDHTIAGVLNDGEDCELLRKTPDATYLGSLRDYKPNADDRVVIAVSSVVGRRKIAALMRECGARLFTYAHSLAWISPSAKLGEGTLVCPHSIVNAGAVIEENVAVNVFCSVGHGAHIGANSVLSPYCSLSGDSSLGEGGFMGTRATIFPKVSLGVGCVVDAHSAVKQSVSDDKIVSVRGKYLVLNNRQSPAR
jgi:UDP-3-O-[3-hydroxymyristoyl] glucosamine N-acyltransferase